MRIILIVLFSFNLFLRDQLVNTEWTVKLSDRCVDKLKFIKNNQVEEYDCEINYTFHNSYSIKKDTLIILNKDDSHSEDHGKVDYFKIKYLIRGNALHPISRIDLINGRWKYSKFKFDKKYFFKREH